MNWFTKKRQAGAATAFNDVPYQPAPRVLPNASHVEIPARRAVIGTELRARLYLHEDRQLLISAVRGIAETGPVTVLDPGVDDETLGRTVCDHLLAFRPRSPDNMRDQKLTDWAVYQASGARSVKRFEEKAWMVFIDTLNSSILFEARPRLTRHGDIFAGGRASGR
eukprot:gene18951-18826_t